MRPASIVYDLTGIGIGPFNLGLAALSSNLAGLNNIFFDEKLFFDWHPGMLIEWTSLQVPFYADLVTLANPCSPFSYLNFLKEKNRLFKFAIREEPYVLRIEYKQYCQWVAAQLCSLHFAKQVTHISYNEAENCFCIHCTALPNKERSVFRTKKIVLGIGTKPQMPIGASHFYCNNVMHSAQYLQYKDTIRKSNSIILIGSGQSAAEIFLDLLQEWHTEDKTITWYTRSERFYPMDTTPFSCEYSTPDYIKYFYRLNSKRREDVLKQQACLYKGINQSLLKQIYNILYLKMVKNADEHIRMQSNCSFRHLKRLHDKHFELTIYNEETGTLLRDLTETVIFATGYTYHIPGFIEPIRPFINFSNNGYYDVAENYSIDKKGDSIFVQNAEMHTHGFNAPDLSLGPYRNGKILNSILGYEHFKFEDRNVFQQFGMLG